MTPRPLADRFWEKVDRSGGELSCWEWKGACRKGYGRIGISSSGRSVALQATRVAYELTVGPIPPGMFVCHTCDNRPCVNPAHLWLGTAQENNDDMVAKGRQKRAFHCPQGHTYDEANTLITKAGRRRCRTCRSAENDRRCASRRRRRDAEFALQQFHSQPGVRAINEALGPSFVGGFEARVLEMFNLSRAS